jgi:hypothetical protein
MLSKLSKAKSKLPMVLKLRPKKSISKFKLSKTPKNRELETPAPVKLSPLLILKDEVLSNLRERDDLTEVNDGKDSIVDGVQSTI